MKFEMSSIINTYKSYQAIQLTAEEIESLHEIGGIVTATIKFLDATIEVQISGKSVDYPESWPRPNIKSGDKL